MNQNLDYIEDLRSQIDQITNTQTQEIIDLNNANNGN